jgi:hypothetical protein
MLHMQHAHVVALIVSQHEATRVKAQRDALAKARRAAAVAERPETQPVTGRRVPKLHRPRPA